jgi:hypothetical protein
MCSAANGFRSPARGHSRSTPPRAAGISWPAGQAPAASLARIGSLDGIVFTTDIGENAARVRKAIG